MFGRSRPSIGLDIGQHAVHWAAVEPAAGRVKEVWSGELLPSRHDKHEALEGHALERRLRELLTLCQNHTSSWSKSVKTAVQGAGSICGYLDLPKLNEKELRTAVPSKLAKQLPFPLDEVFLSHVAVPPLDGDAGHRSGVVYVAVQKKLVEQRTTLLRAVGLEPQALEVPALALARAFARNHVVLKDEIIALVQFGFQLTQVAIVLHGFPYYHRQINTAGADATYAVQMGAQWDWKSSESYKKTYDATQRMVSIEPFLTKWMLEVERTIESFQTRMAQGRKVARAVLLGGGAHWPGLDKRLQEQLEIPVSVENWDKLKVEKSVQTADAAALSLAVGLGLGD